MRKRHELLLRLLLVLPVGALGVSLAQTILALPAPTIDISQQVQARLPESGVSNPVTAVLLNFRSYDTLLEVGVLVLAVVGVWALRLSPTTNEAESIAPLLTTLVRALTPIMIVVAGYLLWAGTNRPGGAFQSGAVVAALGELLILAALVRAYIRHGGWLRVILVAGFAVFLTIALSVMLIGGNLLEYPPGQAYRLILLVETLLTISIGFTLAILFIGADPAAQPPAERTRITAESPSATHTLTL